MSSTTLPMPRKKKEKTESIRLPLRITKRARHLANHEDKSMPDFLTELLASIIDERFKGFASEIGEEVKPPRKKNSH